MKKCPFFGVCGGCRYDFSSPAYRDEKKKDLEKLPITGEPVWGEPGCRRRADFCFSGKDFGFFEKNSKNIVNITRCPNLVEQINEVLPEVSRLPWGCSGSCLITLCDNGIDIAITSQVPYFSTEFRKAAEKLSAIRVSWNGKVIKQTAEPFISFGDTKVAYPISAFLQPCVSTENKMREMVVAACSGVKKVADLFCGLGNFTFALNADGFDIVGTGVKRDLFKNPLTVGMLKNYDCVVMDPPRAGAAEQCKELIKSEVKRIVYVSCNPVTFMRDARTLQAGGYKLQTLIPVDQFVGSGHWEVFSIFDKE